MEVTHHIQNTEHVGLLVDTHHTCFPLLLDPPNLKSFNFSADDMTCPMSIPLLFTIHESKSQHHTIYCRHWDCEMERICRLETAAEAGQVTRVHQTRGLETADHH